MCTKKKYAQELSFICLFLLSFSWRWLGPRLSTAKFHQGFFYWFSMSWHRSGTSASKHAGWWRSWGGHRYAPCKGRCWRKAAAGWLILCYWWPAMLPASSLLVQMHTHWLPLVCARFSLVPAMLAGLWCGHWQDFVDCSLFALAWFEAEDMNAYPHKSKRIYLNRTVSIMYILHSEHPAPKWSQGPLWTCASAVDSCTQKLHLHVTAPPALCPLNPRRPACIPDCWATSTGCSRLLAQPVPMGFALLSRSRGQGWEPPVPAPLQQQTGVLGGGWYYGAKEDWKAPPLLNLLFPRYQWDIKWQYYYYL